MPPAIARKAAPAARALVAAPAKGLTPQQKTQLAQKLIGADLGKAKAAAVALKAEAAAEKSPQLAAVASDRLALIQAEQQQRNRIAQAKLLPFAEGLKALPAAEVAKQLAAAKGQPGQETRALALTREQSRRAGLALAQSGQAEKDRLD